MKILHSVHDTGSKGTIIEVQTHLSNGLPTIQLIGTIGRSLDESKERIRSAFSSSQIEMPRKKITINLSPSDLAKNGAHYDLAIALSILVQAKQIKASLINEKTVYIAEVGLDGALKPVKGILGKIQIAKAAGYTHFVVPQDNEKQASLIPNIYLATSTSLKKVVTALQITGIEFYGTKNGSPITTEPAHTTVDFFDVIGQVAAKRALQIAAAGGHNVLLSGPPGVGKSMLAKAMIGILPPLNREDTITITHLHSLTDSTSTSLRTVRPLRAPHHSSSDVALIGGGQKPRPGEITLAHRGILFLDELPEFKRSTIEGLRQPLEDRQVTVSRAQDTVTYPADFILIATQNPCPCGYYGSSKPCMCSPLEMDRYRKKLSGPMLDRIDIHVTVDSIEHEKLLADNKNNEERSTSKQVQKQVITVLHQQEKRFKDTSMRNGSMSNKDIKRHADLSSSAKQLLDTAASRLHLSARVYMKTVKLARTIADFDDSKIILPRHVAEALQYRPKQI